MQCHHCGQVNAATAFFCVGCGKSLASSGQGDEPLGQDVVDDNTFEKAAAGAEGKESTEAELLKSEQRARIHLRTFRETSKDLMQCENCDYYGRMGVASSAYHPMFWAVIAFIMLAVTAVAAGTKYRAGGFAGIAIVAFRLRQFASNCKVITYECPKCRGESKGGVKYTGMGKFTRYHFGLLAFLLFIVLFITW